MRGAKEASKSGDALPRQGGWRTPAVPYRVR